MKKLAGAARRAINDYNMIRQGDSIAVGISGGKDSMVLLCVLASMQNYYPKKFTLKAISVDMGFNDANYRDIAAFCKKIGVEFILCKTNIAQVLFNVRNEKNPCSLCAKMRKGALNDAAVKNGCKIVALGHHFDDVIQTFILSLFYEARLHCFAPVTYLDRKDITIIRPFIYVKEEQIERYAKKTGIPILRNVCPSSGNTKREYIKNLLLSLEKSDVDIKNKIFNAVNTFILSKKPKRK